MGEHSEETTREKLSNGTISARRILLGTSLVGCLVATMPLSVEKVSVFGISLQIGIREMEGIMILVLIYLAVAFMVRTFTDLGGAPLSPTEKRLRERIASQTQDIKKQSMDRLANLFPAVDERRFHSESFQSLLNDFTIDAPKYREGMINNTLNEIQSWKEEVFHWTAREDPDTDQEPVPPREITFKEYSATLHDLLDSHERSCRRRCLRNSPLWFAYRVFVALRYYFFDALAPSLFSMLVIALLRGWIDESWILNLIRWMAS